MFHCLPVSHRLESWWLYPTLFHQRGKDFVPIVETLSSIRKQFKVGSISAVGISFVNDVAIGCYIRICYASDLPDEVVSFSNSSLL